MSLNFNVAPYNDDFDPSKNFHRILFKPGYAVQARELTQSQTILQDQISKFAANIFSQNTPVTGGKVTTNIKCYYLKLNLTYSGTPIVASSFLNKIIQDSTGTILAKVVATTEATGTASAPGDPPTLIISYVSGAQFTDNLVITPTDGTNIFATTIGTTGGTTSTGLSSVASISDGVFYIVNGYSKSSTENSNGTYSTYSIGNFVSVQPQTVILDKYSNTPSYRIGLSITETIADYITDSSLLDPAVGASNYQAPGADRYQIILTLTTLPLALGNDDQFIELVRIENGSIVKQVDGTVYSVIDDYFAKRDYETNGDYVVNDFKLTPSANTTYSGKYNLNVGPGVAYVRGYRVENPSQYTIPTDRARTTYSVPSNSVFIEYGNYFVVDTLSGIFDVTTMPSVDLHCVQASSIVTTNTATYNSTLVGTAFMRGLSFVSSNGSNTTSYIFNAYVSDINTNNLTGNVSSATTTTLTLSDPTDIFSTVANAYVGMTLSMNTGVDAGDAKVITSYINKTFTVSPAFTITPNSGDTFLLNMPVSNINSIVQKSGTGPYTITANTNINSSSGKLNGNPNGATVLQAAGAPEMIFQMGYPYISSSANSTYYSTQIFRNQGFGIGNAITINTTSPVSFQGTIGTPIYGTVFRQLFTVIDTTTGKILDFSTSANSVTLSSSTSATFTSAAYTALGHNVDIYASVYVSNGDGSSNILKTKTLKNGSTQVYQGGNTTTAVTSTTTVVVDSSSNPVGQVLISAAGISRNALSLYVTDVKGIAGIYDTGSASITPTSTTSLSSYTNITSSFTLDNGQRDNYYDFASIKLLPGVSLPSGNIVVVFNYYLHGGGNGYFNVNSYTNENYAEIPTYLAKDGTTYSLRDSLDFRPARKNAQTSYIWEYSSSFSPSGLLLPNNLSNFQNNYSYYLGRKDKLVLSKDNSLTIIKGTAALNPQPPVEPNGSLVLANISLDPYTAYVPGEGPDGVTSNLSINKVIHKRWAKSDITDLQTQVNNLEYYTSLSILEQNAQSLQVPDSNGINRFKNGILVDDFSSFAAADTSNPSYTANINIRNNTLSPLTSVTNFQLQNPQVLQSYGTLANTNTFAISSINGTQTNLFTLPYTTKELLKQPLASSAISVNPFSVVVHQGIAQLNPPMDNWVNTVEVPSILVTDPNLQTFQQAGGVNLTNAGDWQSLPGTATNFVTAASTAKISAGLAYGITSVSSGVNGVTPVTGTYNSQLTSTNSTTGTSTALINNNGFVTNAAVLPNIRPQQIIVKANGLLVNTPISCYFDGQNVNQFMTTPNTIELTNVSGTFNEDDIVGFYQNGFYPIARVVSIYYYPNGTSVRLYVASYVSVPSSVGSTTLQNAKFDGNGNYTGSTAQGTVPASAVIHTAASGEITGVGGGFTVTGNNTPSNVYNSQTNQAYCTFLNQYGVWGDIQASGAYNASYSIVPSVSGTFTITASTGSTATVSINGSSVLTVSGYTQTYSTTYSFTKGTSYTLSWAATNSSAGNYFGAAFGLTVTDPSGNIIFNTLTPQTTGITYANATETNLVGGGAFFTGATSLQLDQNASSTNNYYNGATITVRTLFVQAYNYGAIYYPPKPTFSGDGDAGNMNAYYNRLAQYQALVPVNNPPQTLLSSSSTYTATIASYNGTTKVATLVPGSTTIYYSTGSAPINYPSVSLGVNKQYGIINSTYSIDGTLTNTQAVQNPGTSLTQLSTNEVGNFTGIFNVPGSVFSTGQRVFRVDNRLVTTDPSTATTYAEATFTASGLQTNNQNLNFGASIDPSAQNILSLSNQSNSTVTSYLNSIQPHIDPIAQTFIVSKDNYPNGVFLNSVKLFFASKPSTNVPVTVSIVGTLNGIPNGKTLDHSTVTLYPNKVNVSSTPYYDSSSTYTEFVFNAPVYIQPGLLYAVIIQSNSTDYTLYYGQQNSIALASTSPNSTNPSKIGAAPYVGALFESQNSITWTADQTKDLMFVLTQCVFDTTVSPTITFVVPKGLPFRKLGVNDVLHNLNQGSVSNLYGTYMNANTPMHAFNVSTTDFVPSVTNIGYQYSTTLLSSQTITPITSITPGKFGTPTPDNIYLNDGQGSRVLSTQSNNSFSLYATLTSTDPNVSPVVSDDGLTLYNIAYFINNMGIDSNVISVANTGLGYFNLTSSNVSISAPDLSTGSTPTFSITSNTTTGAITGLYTTSPGSGYLTTPTITISGSNTYPAVITVQGETSPTGGNSYAKYYTKKVVMTPGNDSGDMRVYFTAYKPVGTGVYIYYRILSSQDTSVFENQNWQLMTQVGNPNAYSTNRTNLIEYECAPGIFNSNQANNNISYVSTNGQTYTNFIQFAIKVVMVTNDNTNVPFLTDLRALALPAGTGI